MSRFRASKAPLFQILWVAPLFLTAAFALAQTASEKPSVDTRRVGARLACQCGGCKDTLATCSMLECSFSKPAKEKIAKMQALGMTDQQIIQTFVGAYPGIYLAPPNLFGILIPYVAAMFGLAAIWWFIRRYRKPAPMADLGPMELDDPALAKYKDQIEKDLANLE
jgi:cytochrome c-type biogenesis protein CcmH/NrfF